MLFTRVDPIVLRPAWLGRFATSMLVGRYVPEERHPVSRVLFRAYEPVCRWVLRHRAATLVVAVLLMASTVPAFLRLGSEFMPPLHEGAFLYMPTTLPGMSVTEAQRILQVQDRALRQFPEVERVFGKAGRATTPTDPAPLSMVETTVVLKPESEWRPGVTFESLQAEMDAAIRVPGMPNIWTMPIRNRIDMLSTGVRTPIGIKVLGPDLAVIQDIGTRIEALMPRVAGTRTVVAERTAGGYYVDFELDRAALARYGLTVDDAQAMVLTAVGGEPVTTTVEGRERYTVAVRYARDFRDDLDALARVLVPTPSGAQVPMGRLARLRTVEGPSMIRNESGQLAGYVFVDMAGRDLGGYVTEAKELLRRELVLPPGYTLVWSGQYENLARVRERLTVVVPLTLALITLLLYLNTKSGVKTAIVLTAVPFSLIGAVWLLWALDYNLSIAVWVGMIALMGLDAETGVFMLLYLDLAYDERKRAGTLHTRADLDEAIVHGAVKRVRPKLMTVVAAFMGLLPIMWSTGAGADVMKRIAAPMVGGLGTSFALELLVYPALFAIWKRRSLPEGPTA
jgi:Cu(I)/Ag(I) efflux system membrane protein CusA/SilA